MACIYRKRGSGRSREPDVYRGCSNRLLGGWRAYDAEAAPPHSDPQLRTEHGSGTAARHQYLEHRKVSE